MRGSKLGPLGNVAYAGKRPTWGPMEAKSGPLGVMTLPTSLRQDNPENYSGEGRDQDGEEANSSSAARAALGEAKEIEGSAEASHFPGGFGLNVNTKNLSSTKVSPETESSLNQGHSELVTVTEHTTLSHWQLVEQPTTTPSQDSQKPDTAEEARGEILYVRRPTGNLASASSHRGEGSNSDSTPVIRNHSKSLGRDSSYSEIKMVTSTPEALMEMLTTSEVSTAGLLTTRDIQRTDPTTTATTTEISSDSSSNKESSIPISWVQGETEKTTSSLNQQDSFSATLSPSVASQTNMGVIHLTTITLDSKVDATAMESRSAVSESFVLGSRWTPIKGVSPNSEEHKAPMTTDSKDSNNPFGILVPNWAFGLIPSGM